MYGIRNCSQQEGIRGGNLPDVPIPYQILALRQERNNLFSFPFERLVDEIKGIGFRCSGCGSCCTQTINRHIFLLDHDVAALNGIDPVALVPAPDPEFCDQNGTFYVSGYAVRMKGNPSGSCWFLEKGRCRIYDRRFSVCRIYPYMLRRTRDAGGDVSWRYFSRMDEHGCYLCNIPDSECSDLAREIREYENAVLAHQISFLETIQEHFMKHNLIPGPGRFGRRMQGVSMGEPVKIMVYHAGELREYRDPAKDPSGDSPQVKD